MNLRKFSLGLTMLCLGFSSAVSGAEKETGERRLNLVQDERVITDVTVEEAATRGVRYLESMFEPGLDLLPEFQGSKTYWLYHDNYLAAKVLRPTQPKLADRIEAAIRSRGVTKSGKIEIVMGEAKDALPFRDYELRDVAKLGDKVIRTEVVLDRVNKGWEQYADLCFLAAMAEKDEAKALVHFQTALKMWDGRGFRDRATEVSGLYATYKLALALLAAKRFDHRVRFGPGWDAAKVQEQMLSMQGGAGGWITDYNAKGEKKGLMNVETTSLAILGLRARLVQR